MSCSNLQPGEEEGSADQGWMALVKAVEQLAGARELSQIVEIIRSTARDISGADGVCFVLRDGERCHYVDEDAIAPLWKGKRFPMSACIAGWCMTHNQTAVVTDVFNDPRVPIDSYRPTFIKSMVLVPIRTQEPVGAIGFYWDESRSFAVEDLGLIEALGRSASAAFAAVKAHEESFESEQRLAMALDAGGLGAFEIDLNSGDLKTTPVCKAIFGRRPDDTFSREEMVATFHPADRNEAAKVLGLPLEAAARPSRDTVYRLHHQGDDKYIELQERLILDVDGRPSHISGVVRDVTDRILAKERLDNLRAEMLRASRLNDLGTMASALAHELNQPLAAGSNYLNAAERFLAKDPQKALDAMVKAGGQFVRTKEIIQRIRGFVGQSGSLKSREDIEHVCREVLELMRVTTRHEGVHIHFRAEPGLPKIEIDKVQIQQVLVNLLRNAIEATAGCPIRQVSLHASRAGEMIELRLHDSGPGLAPEIAQHLFQPFHSTKEGGMGVGLSLCRQIVDSHGGKLWHEAAASGGAVFCFSLPLSMS